MECWAAGFVGGLTAVVVFAIGLFAFVKLMESWG